MKIFRVIFIMEKLHDTMFSLEIESNTGEEEKKWTMNEEVPYLQIVVNFSIENRSNLFFFSKTIKQKDKIESNRNFRRIYR